MSVLSNRKNNPLADNCLEPSLTTKISKLQNIMKTVNLHEKQVLGKSSVLQKNEVRIKSSEIPL